MRPASPMLDVVRSLLDLVLPATCAGCGHAGSVVCSACAAELHTVASLRMPSPAPVGLPAPYAVADYAGVVRDLLLAYKERGVSALRGPLSRALAGAVAAAADSTVPDAEGGGRDGALVLVPVPSSRTARRQRGDDVVALLADSAARHLTRLGRPARMARLLRHSRRVRDSAGLTAQQRAGNLRGAFATRPGAVAALHRGDRPLLVDDLVTTGSTLGEAARALRVAGIRVDAAATVAATRRKPQLIRLGLPAAGREDYGAR